MLKVYRRYLDGYTDSLHPRLPVGAVDLPYAVSSSAHSAAVVVPGAAVALAEKPSLVEAQQFVNIIIQQQQQQHMSQSSESMRGVEKEEGILKANTRIEVLGLGFKVYSKPGFRV